MILAPLGEYVQKFITKTLYTFQIESIEDLVTGRMFVNPIAFLDESSLQYNSSLLVSLIILSGELVHPAQLGVTVLTVDVPDHVPPSEHHPVHDLTQM